ncbi:MAG: prenyltransferase [Chloroflexaceae bacterium]
MSTGGLLARAADFAALGRPLHLIGGAIFYGLGVAVAGYAGAPLNGRAAILGLLTVAAAQLMNHYCNDYFDLEADRANPTPTRWSGGSRVLAEERLPARAALVAALSFGALALSLAPLTALASPAPAATLSLLGVAIALAWVYSGPPLFLHRRALGEVTGAILVPGLTALVGYQAQMGAIGGAVLLAVVPLCLLQFAMLVAVNVPDAAGDAAVGKHTMVVRVGAARAAQFYLAALGLAYGSLPVLALAGLPWPAALAHLATLPIAAWLAYRVLRGAWHDPRAWESIGFWSIGQLVGSAGMLTTAFTLLAGR